MPKVIHTVLGRGFPPWVCLVGLVWAWVRDAVKSYLVISLCIPVLSVGPENLLLPLPVSSLHMGLASGPPRALGEGGEEYSPNSAGGQPLHFLGKGPPLCRDTHPSQWHSAVPCGRGWGGSHMSFLDLPGGADIPVTESACLLKSGLNETLWASGGLVCGQLTAPTLCAWCGGRRSAGTGSGLFGSGKRSPTWRRGGQPAACP